MAGPSSSFVALVLIACAAGALAGLSQQAVKPRLVELRIREIVRVRGGQPVLVLEEIAGQRRLPVPITRAEAALIERGLHPGGLASETVEALGGRVLGACIDEISSDRGFRGHLLLGAGSRELRLDATAGEALTLAVQAGAPILADPEVLEEAAVSPGGLRGRAVRDRTRGSSAPAPVLHI